MYTAINVYLMNLIQKNLKYKKYINIRVYYFYSLLSKYLVVITTIT